MENFFDETVFIVHTALTGMLYLAYQQCKNLVATLDKLPTYEVGRQLNSALEASSNGTLDYAAVYGRVQALGDPLQSSHGRPAVIRLLLSVDHFRNKLFSATWGASENLVSSTSSFVPFGIRSPIFFGKSTIAVVDEPTSADLTNILVTVGSKFLEADSSIVGSFMSTLAGRQRVGTETTEKILPVDSMMTAIGKVARFPDGTTHISHPVDPSGALPFVLTTLSLEGRTGENYCQFPSSYYDPNFSPSGGTQDFDCASSKMVHQLASVCIVSLGIILFVAEIKTSYKVQLRSYGFGTLLLGSIAGFFAVRVLCKYVSTFYIKKLRRDIIRKRSPNGILGLHDSQICITCLSNPREVLFVPCGHICTCVDCWAKLEDHRCPVCRELIVYSYPAFIP